MYNLNSCDARAVMRQRLTSWAKRPPAFPSVILSDERSEELKDPYTTRIGGSAGL
jgi:hypothetical protein